MNYDNLVLILREHVNGLSVNVKIVNHNLHFLRQSTYMLKGNQNYMFVVL